MRGTKFLQYKCDIPISDQDSQISPSQWVSGYSKKKGTLMKDVEFS